MDQLEWSECGETLDDILKNPRVQLPQVIKLSSNLNDISKKETLEKGQFIIIHSKETVQQLQGTDASGKTILIPKLCPHKIRRKVTPGKEKVFETIKDLAKTEPLPRFVEVRDVQSTVTEKISPGDRLKVVIVEKTGGVPSFIHFRSSAGKHVKLSVEENISFQLSVNDGSEQLIEKLSEKSKEFPLSAEFVKNNELPKSHSDLGTFTITDTVSEDVVIASAIKNSKEYGIIFPLHSHLKFQVNSKLKMAKDEDYRGLCSNASTVDPQSIKEFVNHHNPCDDEIYYIIKYKELLKRLKFDYSTEGSDSDDSPKTKSKSTKKQKEKTKESKKVSKEENVIHSSELRSESPKSEEDDQENDNNDEQLPENTLTKHSEQKEILKREIKEREKQAKLEKERLKAEKKKEKKEKKEKEKEEKKRKKKLSSSSSIPSSPIENTDNDLYIVPQSLQEEPEPTVEVEVEDNQQSQLAMYLMNKVKKVRDRTQSFGTKKNKKRRLRKEDIEYLSSDQLDSSQRESIYTDLGGDDAFSESLYEALPGDMAYESLDLVAQAQRSLAPPPIPTETSGDSGFDEIDQARIQAWRDSMAPPPLPGNHPMQKQTSQGYDEENLYEMAVDTKNANPSQNMAAWQNFYDSVQQSTNEIASWDMEDVANCLSDLQLGKYNEIFADSQVDGQLLLDLDESVLLDLGLTSFEARKLRKFVFGWRPDMMRPSSYPVQKGFDSKDPAEWSQADAVKHLQIIEINDFADFCNKNQVNGELLKDICVDETIMATIITTKDRKLKSVKIKNYVIDQWRPKKKGEGNYVSSSSILPPEKRAELSQSKPTKISPKIANKMAKVTESANESSPYTSQRRKIGENSSVVLGVNKKSSSATDAPLIAKMKQQLEENKNSWEQKKKSVQYI